MVFKNLFRRKGRTALTILGISVAAFITPGTCAQRFDAGYATSLLHTIGEWAGGVVAFGLTLALQVTPTHTEIDIARPGAAVLATTSLLALTLALLGRMYPAVPAAGRQPAKALGFEK